jgi:ubiquinone/menaquinone biosynthesis C-methylase UbiE
MNELTQKHKHIVSEVFNRTADKYGTVGPDYLGYFGYKIVEYADINEGQIILDMACGRGASLFPALDKIGSTGKIIGIDLAGAMIRNTKLEIKHATFNNIELYEMDIEALSFMSNTFDIVLCGFSLFFFPNLDIALSEINRVLKPGGVFVTSTFGKRDKRWQSFRELMANTQKNLPPISLAQTKILDTEDEIINQFTESGFKGINVFKEEKEFYYQDESDWWQTMWSQGYRGFLERLDKQSLQVFKKESFKIISKIKNKNGIPEKFQVLITKATN